MELPRERRREGARLAARTPVGLMELAQRVERRLGLDPVSSDANRERSALLVFAHRPPYLRARVGAQRRHEGPSLGAQPVERDRVVRRLVADEEATAAQQKR